MRSVGTILFFASAFSVLNGEQLVTSPPKGTARPLTSDPVPFPPDDLVAPFVSKVTALPDYSLQDLLQPFLGGQGQAKVQEEFDPAQRDPLRDTTAAEAARNPTPFEGIKEQLMRVVESRGKAVARQFSSLSFPSLEAALLSLAFLTFAVFLIDLVQDVLSTNSTSTGRHTRNARDPEEDQRTTDLIVLALTSLDTVSHGRENPECGQKLLCHLNRSGWHDDGILGTASNYVVSLFLTLFSPESGFQRNLDAAQYGRDKQECVDRYTSCPSILGDLIYHR
ncbi:uncharacterized protein LOC119583736 [Penaeus monodon]|uniref:uncharacterized protein LOC119583736 n=1 Tax=Penaeus monodon TaxID=6687 RepID=UPI0018A7A5A7|nr:uncharacterized protein LOC119583736 [Penaeus monodon]